MADVIAKRRILARLLLGGNTVLRARENSLIVNKGGKESVVAISELTRRRASPPDCSGLALSSQQARARFVTKASRRSRQSRWRTS